MSRKGPFLRRVTAFLLAGSLSLAACTPVRNPATGEVQYTSMTPAEEAELGRKEHPKILKSFGGAYQDPQLAAYVNEVGERVARVSDTPQLRFTFTLLDTPVVNAFALPGGYVYVTRGLLALVNNEAELAGVLGHEIGHVAARHAALRYDQALLGQMGALGATILGAVLLGDSGARLGADLGNLAATAYVQGYSREQEYEADELGIRYLVRAGYDARAMASFLDTLERYDALQAKLRGGRGQEVPSWLASHPRTVDRVRRAAARAMAAAGGMTNRDRLLAAIDGIVYGDSPAQGWVEGRSFVHPALRFRFTAPEGIRLQNNPDRVVGVDKKRKRLLLFDMSQRKPGISLARYVRRVWAKEVDLDRLEPGRTARGYEAVIAIARVRVGGEPRRVFLGAIAGEGGVVYRFFYLPRRMNRAERRRFEEILDSFERLTPSAAAKLKPLRIVIHRVTRGETVDGLAARMAIARLPREYFLVLNALGRGMPLQPGQKVKLILRK